MRTLQWMKDEPVTLWQDQGIIRDKISFFPLLAFEMRDREIPVTERKEIDGCDFSPLFISFFLRGKDGC